MQSHSRRRWYHRFMRATCKAGICLALLALAGLHYLEWAWGWYIGLYVAVAYVAYAVFEMLRPEDIPPAVLI